CIKILWHVRLRPIFECLNCERRSVTGAYSSGSLLLFINPHPVAKIAVRFQHRLEPIAIDRSLYCHLPARRQFLARFLRQPQNSPLVDRVKRGVKPNCWHPFTLIHSGRICLQSYDPELKVNARARAIAREAGWVVTPQDACGYARWP